MPLSDATRALLKRVSTATVATCLFKRGLRSQMIQGALPIHRVTESMVGEAMTVRYIPAREDLNTLDVFRNPEHPQRKAIEHCPRARCWCSTAGRTPARPRPGRS